ncbi:efflux RND transporter periplasmic adaptor subunit [Marinomonas transparens]|uniref:Efflux RND transporter periplasmic adaptor subunit n=1 Tax=Marinomonas transparens TaxID=2795388 RepID=A0A934JXD3_9GAMM|nr:efflux RND transporter periplasmic adaptor subunit [Marinomonas transparens]MBJ7539015.1 efflux RND transporter periplasmic adaptor subunit [Marinomonas transparens]
MEWKSKVGPITAVVIASGLVAWMVLSGNGITVSPTGAQPVTTEKEVSNQQAENLIAYSVQAKALTVQSIAVHLPLSGKTLANESLTLTNTYPGRVTKVLVEKGTFVKKGDAIIQIDTRTLKSQLSQAKLLVKQRKLELDGMKKLKAGNFASKVNLAQAETELASAQANEKALLVSLENATVTAPFSGILNTLDVQQGQVIADKTSIGTLIALNPIRITVNIPQNKIYQITQGTTGEIALESGQKVEGVVSYISAAANESSRSISVELLVDNPDNSIPTGLTAKVDFILDEQKAHAFSPALLTLDNDGKTAIKTIDLDNKVKLIPVEVIKSDRDEIWVSGLPDQVNIITVGQGFVNPGDTVDAHYQN